MNRVIKIILIIVSTIIAMFMLIGSIVMFSVNQISGAFFYIALAVIFTLPIIFYTIHHREELKAAKEMKKIKNEENKRLAMQKIENQQFEYENQILMQQQAVQNQRQELLKQREQLENSTFNVNQKQANENNTAPIETITENVQTQIAPAELLLMKIDSLSTSGIYFENVVCELLKANEFINVETTKASNDYGIDILAEKDGITYAIQCKCYSSSVGNKAIQEAYTGKNFYNRMIAVVATNSTFTKNAIETAKSTQVLLWDRNKLIQMISKLDDNKIKEIVNITT